MFFLTFKKFFLYIKEQCHALRWLLPFFVFFSGYQIPRFFFQTTLLEVPSLLGKNSHESLVILSKLHIAMRVIEQKEDATLPEGTVIAQIPAPFQKIKCYQTLFVTTTTRPQQKKAPLCIGRNLQEIRSSLADEKIKYKAFLIPSNHPSDFCIAQYPAAEEFLGNETLILYLSHNIDQKVLFPNVVGCSLEEVKAFFKNYDVTPQIFHEKTMPENHTCEHCIISEQKPLAGSFINLNQTFSVQLKIS